MDRSELSDQVPRKGSKKMGKRGKLYSPEFKEETIQLVHSSNEKYPVAKVARDLDISAKTLRKKWVNQAQIDAGERDGLTTVEKEELRRLRKEVKVLKEEHEILKKRHRSSPGRRTSERAGDLHLYRDREGKPQGERDVQGVEGLQERLLWLGEIDRLPLGLRQTYGFRRRKLSFTGTAARPTVRRGSTSN
jgi:transposase